MLINDYSPQKSINELRQVDLAPITPGVLMNNQTMLLVTLSRTLQRYYLLGLPLHNLDHVKY